MPQGSSALPGWFVNVINEVIKGLEKVAAYLDDVVSLDFDPTAHVKTIQALFERIRKHNLKLSPSKLASAPRTQFFWATPFRPRV